MKNKTLFVVIPLIVLLLGLVVPCVYGGLVSSFSSSVAEISIPNTHIVLKSEDSQRPLVLRGNAPRDENDLDALIQYGVKKILIFKNKTRDQSVEREMVWLDQKKVDYLYIPFLWKDINFQEACEQTIQALMEIKKALSGEKALFFHCTVGEDRTGYLAGLARWYFQNWSPAEAFQQEMCAHGYGSGNKRKPRDVVREIRKNLTPLFLKMVYLLKNDSHTGSGLTLVSCDQDPIETMSTVDKKIFLQESRWTCK